MRDRERWKLCKYSILLWNSQKLNIKILIPTDFLEAAYISEELPREMLGMLKLERTKEQSYVYNAHINVYKCYVLVININIRMCVCTHTRHFPWWLSIFPHHLLWNQGHRLKPEILLLAWGSEIWVYSALPGRFPQPHSSAVYSPHTLALSRQLPSTAERWKLYANGKHACKRPDQASY